MGFSLILPLPLPLLLALALELELELALVLAPGPVTGDCFLRRPNIVAVDEEGEEEEDDADDAIEHRRERGFRVAGALHRAAIDPEGTLTRTIDVDTISDGGSKGL